MLEELEAIAASNDGSPKEVIGGGGAYRKQKSNWQLEQVARPFVLPSGTTNNVELDGLGQ